MAGGAKGGQGGRGNKSGSHRKGAQAGSGGQKRKGLAGKGPTPKASNRPAHPAARRARTASKAAAASDRGASSRGGSAPQRSRSRVRAGAEIVAGRNSVVEALRARIPATALYVAGRIESDDRVREAITAANKASIPVLEAPRAELDRLTDGAVHQGLALQVPAYEYAELDGLLARARDAKLEPLLVLLDGVTDPRNLGAVVRSAAAFGAHGVVVPERRSAGMTAGAWKASAGAASRLPVARVTNVTRTIKDLQAEGVVVVGLDAKGELDVSDLTLAGDAVCVVIGSEDKGLSRLVSETCDLLVRIPMVDETESLNASVAASIVLHAIAAGRAATS
jgi:23S rRNA (guanosine2251-2'-O)-methyltransferase